MSLAEKLEQAGFEKGWAESELRTQRRIARQMLEQEAGPDFVAKVTGLSLDDVQALTNANDSQ